MEFQAQSDWLAALGLYVEIRDRGRFVRAGTVDAVMPDGSLLWLSAEGAWLREIVEKKSGMEVVARYERQLGVSS